MRILRELSDIGFGALSDLGQTVVYCASSKKILAITITSGAVSSIVESYIGLSWLAYSAFIMLIAAEFWLSAKVDHIGSKITVSTVIDISKDITIKILTYTFLFGFIYTLSQEYKKPEVLGMTFNVYEFIFHVAFNIITVALIKSVFKNLSVLGYKEAYPALKAIGDYLERTFFNNNKK